MFGKATLKTIKALSRPKIRFHGKAISPRVAADTTFEFNPLTRAKTPEQLAKGKEARLIINEKIKSGAYPLTPHCCYICDGTDFRRVAEVDRFGLRLPTSICTSCGLVQANPALPQETLFDFYRHYYRDLYGHSRNVSEVTIRRKAAKSGAAVYDLASSAKVLPAQHSGDLIVEVGAGDGALVSYFADRGHSIIGVDFDEEYMATARALGYDLRTGPLKDVRLPSRPKLVYYNHVLEHIADLNGEVSTLSDILDVGSHVAIVVPGIKHLNFGSYKGDLISYLQIAHVAHFSLTTLTRLFARHGFELVTGNEKVQAIFRKTGRPDKSDRSEYYSALYSLRHAERTFKSA